MACLNLKGDEWDRILWDIEAEYWAIQRGRLKQLDFITQLAIALAHDPQLIMNSLSGEWDFRPEPTISLKGLAHKVHPMSSAFHAVCRRELRESNWQVFVDAAGNHSVVRF